MYPYHNKIKSRILNNELVSYEYLEKYKTITPCLLLHFSTEPKTRPIREHRFQEYEDLFKQLNEKDMDPKDIKKEYTNGEVTIVWQSGKCIHSGNCVKNNPDVFKPREQPWINPDNSTTEKIIDAVNKCPSGALSFYMNKK